MLGKSPSWCKAIQLKGWIWQSPFCGGRRLTRWPHGPLHDLPACFCNWIYLVTNFTLFSLLCAFCVFSFNSFCCSCVRNKLVYFYHICLFLSYFKFCDSLQSSNSIFLLLNKQWHFETTILKFIWKFVSTGL